ncbi:cobalamin biosynthesis protein [Mycolicibacterium sp. NCC-Tsukiji]|uniref:cobalamin biosynthesis protein n=1 Tax=Mycolicibacterium sp. NCC-Tsukiji TaxID=2185272 RepID=UPI000EBACC70|nr:cobalamin biosynthesis protein [Mycolicibacterium sp. NCC-Tsukiji]GCB00654.1 cobalamin biosynthesis protein CobD [Mycolicibacterium sp. NCC-Tsukiji]
MFDRSAPRAAGLALGYLADVCWADPRRGHPVALFGTAAVALERRTYSDNRLAGAGHAAALLVGLGALGLGLERVARGPVAKTLVTAAATYTVLGGTSLARTGADMAARLERGDVAAARELLPSLCGRDPSALDADGLARAALESVAENTSDAQVAPILWGAVAGVPGLLVYRGANTLDAMIGHLNPRYTRFGWAAARFDDVLNYGPARVTGLCVMAASRRPAAAWRAWRADAHKHPSPNAGVAEASFAGALGVRLGGATQYAHRLEMRPTLGAGPAPVPADLRHAVRLTRRVQALATVVAVGLSGAGRSGRRASARSSPRR